MKCRRQMELRYGSHAPTTKNEQTTIDVTIWMFSLIVLSGLKFHKANDLVHKYGKDNCLLIKKKVHGIMESSKNIFYE